MGNKPCQAKLKGFTAHCIQQRDFWKRSWLNKNKMVNLVILYSLVYAVRQKNELLCQLEELAGGERFSYLLINDFYAASDSFLSFAGCGLIGEFQKITSLSGFY
ncbi:hypothetical protein CEXT_793041 [Caerostris extrusa]|uniref:Uncharacterized protein n=1 Tax=Caerostris extrusa TaxID=172846 RepID=A0AAV4VFP3_CAEEX|nr:hypothetical protein CEXT_793041 [Caerostris extrusa]